MDNNFYKTKICKDWETFGTCSKESYCKYAHGENEIQLAKCKYGLKCYNKKCNFTHPIEKNNNNSINTYYNFDNDNEIFQYYLKEMDKHIKICKNRKNVICDILGPLLKKELINSFNFNFII